MDVIILKGQKCKEGPVVQIQVQAAIYEAILMEILSMLLACKECKEDLIQVEAALEESLLMEIMSKHLAHAKDLAKTLLTPMRTGYGCGLGYGYVVPTQRTVAASAAGAATTAVVREEMEQLRQRGENTKNQHYNQGRMLKNAEN